MKLSNKKKTEPIVNECTILGFVGFNREDLVIWSSQLFKSIGKRVLIMDYTIDSDLSYIVPLPEGYSKVKNEVFEYQGVFYVNVGSGKNIEEFSCEYDIVLADFGKQINNPQLEKCNVVYTITNLDVRKIEYIKGIGKYEKNFLVVKDYIRLNNIDQYILKELGFEKSKTFYIDRNNSDFKEFLLGQWNQNIEMRTISYETRELLVHIAEQTNIDRKTSKEALKMAMKRKVS